MKTKIYFFLLMFSPFFVFSQKINSELSNVNRSLPYFTGIQKINNLSSENAYEKLNVFFCDNFNCPNVPLDCLREGTVVVRFKILPSGELSDFEVTNSVCSEIDQEFIRLIKNTEGMWSQRIENGLPVAMEKELSMMFVVSPYVNNPKEYFSAIAAENLKKGNKFLFEKGNIKKALKHYNESIKYRPNEVSTLLVRGLCRYEIGDNEGACKDWNRINALGKANVDDYINNLCEMEGYAEMQAILNK